MMVGIGRVIVVFMKCLVVVYVLVLLSNMCIYALNIYVLNWINVRYVNQSSMYTWKYMNVSFELKQRNPVVTLIDNKAIC